MNKKEFKTLDEQLDIFKNKGLTINDEEYAKEVLLKENYFFLNGYRYIFMISNKDKKFIRGATFNELYSMFSFDRDLRNILFKNLLIVENNIKSIISYKLSIKYGYKEKNYLKETNFITDHKEQRRVNDVLNKMKRQIRVNAQNHTATLHYLNNYGYIPLWVLVKVLSFGLINELYGILKLDDKVEISQIYNLKVEDMGIYLALLANYRNLCAHEDIVFDHKTQRYINDTKYHKELGINKSEENEYIKGKNDIFALLIILKQMLDKDKFTQMMNEINIKLQDFKWQVKSINIEKLYDMMGLPNNYMDIIDID
ncbi:MAG: Abi family protein [Bacilli bacterium]|nr:Abi family protein [Bacilli bacterium]MBP3635142.1 Abi family protein [Bacilli bacterium]